MASRLSGLQSSASLVAWTEESPRTYSGKLKGQGRRSRVTFGVTRGACEAGAGRGLASGVQRVGGVALGFKPKDNFDGEPADISGGKLSRLSISVEAGTHGNSIGSRQVGREVPAGALSANAGRGPWGLIVYPVTCSELHPALSRLPGGPLLRWRYPNYCHSRPRSRGSVRCRYSDYGMDSLHATIQHSKEGMPSILKQPTPLPLHLPLIRGLQTYMC